MQEFITTCELAARSGGEVLLQWRNRVHPQSKAPSDFVTEADLASQQTIQELISNHYPDHDFLGEERTSDSQHGQSGTRPEFRWIVDPLDGTTNFIHGLEHYCVSVALQRNSQLIVAAVYDPVRDECFSATLGGGARLNGRPITSSPRKTLADALVAGSFSAKVPRGSDEVGRFVELLHRCRALRRMGSAALNLCYVAAGRMDAYWATSVKTWDVAAGVLLIREAGGVVTALDGSELVLEQPRIAASANSRLHAELIDALSVAS